MVMHCFILGIILQVFCDFFFFVICFVLSCHTKKQRNLNDMGLELDPRVQFTVAL